LRLTFNFSTFPLFTFTPRADLVGNAGYTHPQPIQLIQAGGDDGKSLDAQLMTPDISSDYSFFFCQLVSFSL
jgi:hypothetical protein